MSTSILVGFASRYGTTQETAEVIGKVLREKGFLVDVLPARTVRTLEGYQAVILGAPLFMFHWHKDILRLLSRFKKSLLDQPVFIFALGPTHVPYEEQEWKDSRVQLDKELANYPWLKPSDIQIFGGKFDPEKIGFPFKMFVGQVPASNLQDLQAVRTWAYALVEKLKKN